MDSRQWGALWALLIDRFQGKQGTEIAVFYHDELTARLTDDEITEAVRRVLFSSTFFPSPADIVAAARPTVATSGLVEWELCQRVMEGDRNALARMSSAGQRLVRLLGGEERLRATSLDSVPFVRKEWLALYADTQDIVEREESLPRGPELALLPPGTRVSDHPEPTRLPIARVHALPPAPPAKPAPPSPQIGEPEEFEQKRAAAKAKLGLVTTPIRSPT